MANFRCNFLEYLPVYLVSSISDNDIVPVTGETLRVLSLSGEMQPDETQKQKEGTDFFEQTIKATIKYNKVSEIDELLRSYHVLRITDVDGNTMVWGSVQPYNPVKASIRAGKQFADVTFSRESEMPEF